MSMEILAGGCIVKDNKVLLVQQTENGDQPERWGPPAGHASRGESLTDTARREIAEETGLDVDFLGLVQAGFFQHKGKDYVIALFYAVPNGDRNIQLQETEAKAYVWASLDDLKSGKYRMRKKFLEVPLILALTQRPSPLNTFTAVEIEKD